MAALLLLAVFAGSCSRRILTAEERRLAAEDGIKLNLIGRGILDGDWMQRTRCYEVSNSLIKSCAKKHKIVYSIVPARVYELLLVLWYFNQTHGGENQINIITVDDRGDKKIYRRNYPYSLQWLRNIENDGWPDSLLYTEREGLKYPKEFARSYRDDKAVVYDSTFVTLYMPAYGLLIKNTEERDSLSPIFRTYKESYEHIVFPLVDSIMAKEYKDERDWWRY